MRGGHSLLVVVATVLTGLGGCAIAASVMAVPGLLNANPWLVAGAGVAALTVGLAFLAASFVRRDRSIGNASKHRL
jgi:membrane protein implicated in regulation of membrane protease activity